MPSNGLIVLAGIKAGREERLRATLNRIGNDINGQRLRPGAPESHLDFPASRLVHFARLAVLDDPDRGTSRQRLLLATDYDGGRAEHIAELFQLTSDPDALWGCCEDYRGPASFANFIQDRVIEPQAYYIAFPGDSVGDVNRAVQRRKQFELVSSVPISASFRLRIERFVHDIRRAFLLMVDLLSLLWRHGPINAVLAARQVNATLNRVWWIRLFNRLTLNSLPSPKHRHSAAPVNACADCIPATVEDEIVSKTAWTGAPAEDLVSQNQLTLLTAVHSKRLRRLRAVLAIIELFAKRLSPPGSLVGINTIHTVRWALLDKGRRLLLISNYDGSWEHYIDEFAEMILSGLDAIWGSSFGYPESGAQDVAALKHFLRCHQVPANVFYSAYPEATVLNILDGRKLAQRQSAAPQPAPGASP